MKRSLLFFMSCWLFSVVLVVVFVSVASAQTSKKMVKNIATEQASTRTFWNGDRGEFQYPWNDQQEFVVWHNAENGSKSGIVGATITSSTKITVKNHPEINRLNLFLLSGRQVAVLALIRETGRGEGSKQTCKELEIVMIEKE